jgi:hypothetical protein
VLQVYYVKLECLNLELLAMSPWKYVTYGNLLCSVGEFGTWYVFYTYDFGKLSDDESFVAIDSLIFPDHAASTEHRHGNM